jgi:hypothetical protein
VIWIWHYTVNHNAYIGSIISDGVIKREGECGRQASLVVARRKLYVPGVWFSANQTYEATAQKIFIDGNRKRPLPQIKALPMTARIGVDPAPDIISWHDYKYRSLAMLNLTAKNRQLALKIMQSMETVGIESGADPGEWFVCLDRVPVDRWRAIQVFSAEHGWIDAPFFERQIAA